MKILSAKQASACVQMTGLAGTYVKQVLKQSFECKAVTQQQDRRMIGHRKQAKLKMDRRCLRSTRLHK